MAKEEIVFVHGGQNYGVIVTYKAIRNVYYRFKDGVFSVSAPYATSHETIRKGLRKYFDRLTRGRPPRTAPIGLDYVYVFGQRKALKIGKDLPSRPGMISVRDQKELKMLLEKMLLKELKELVPLYEKRLRVKEPYKIRVRTMKSRYGSNSPRTHTLSFQSGLIHFARPIIISVIIHELVHDRVSGHGPSFYRRLLHYCPNYHELFAKLRKGEYA